MMAVEICGHPDLDGRGSRGNGGMLLNVRVLNEPQSALHGRVD
jgi:hypothetical protein